MGTTDIDLDGLPRRVPRERAAAIVRQYYFDVSPRTLERAPLTWRILNKRAHVETIELIEWASSVVNSAPAIRGGSRATHASISRT